MFRAANYNRCCALKAVFNSIATNESDTNPDPCIPQFGIVRESNPNLRSRLIAKVYSAIYDFLNAVSFSVGSIM